MALICTLYSLQHRLDKVTDSVRAFYEAYPYPPGDRVDCDGYQARWLLSTIERPAMRTPLQVLEAGCGRGLNLQMAAGSQPEAVFTGIDINRPAIEQARQACAKQGQDNVRFHLADLMQAESLPEVPGGYDLILSYGVIHHLSNPREGLRRLRDLLSPQGVVALMIDGHFGRQPLDRFVQALALLPNSHTSNAKRLVDARALARLAERSLFRGTYWQGTAEVDEVEFADRCLHVHEQSYTIEGLWELLTSAGLRFLRWLEPADWLPAGLLGELALSPLISALEPVQQYCLIERLYERPKLTLLAIPEGAVPRRPLLPEAVPATLFRLNPQLKRERDQSGEPAWQLRQQPPTGAATACAEAILREADSLGSDFSGDQIVSLMAQRSEQRRQALQTLRQLEAAEWLYRPHPMA